MERCQMCGGDGRLASREPVYRKVTRDMAIDAGDRSMEGTMVQSGYEDCYEQCPNCKGTGEV